MTKRSLLLLSLAFALITVHLEADAHPDTPSVVMPTISEKTASAQKLPGYFNLYWDAKQGSILWKVRAKPPTNGSRGIRFGRR